MPGRCSSRGTAAFDGGLQEHLVWPDRLLHPLPDAVSDDAAALLEPLGVAIHAVGVGHVRPGTTSWWSEPGRSAYSSARWPAGRAPAGCFVSEPLAHRRRDRGAFGADKAWAAGDGTGRRGPRPAAGRGVDVVVEMAGADEGLTTAVTLRPHGRPDRCRRDPVDAALGASRAAQARRKGLTFVMVRRMHETYRPGDRAGHEWHRSRRAGQRSASSCRTARRRSSPPRRGKATRRWWSCHGPAV